MAANLHAASGFTRPDSRAPHTQRFMGISSSTANLLACTCVRISQTDPHMIRLEPARTRSMASEKVGDKAELMPTAAGGRSGSLGGHAPSKLQHGQPPWLHRNAAKRPHFGDFERSAAWADHGAEELCVTAKGISNSRYL